MPFLTVLWTIFKLFFATLFAWACLTSAVGALRYGYRPLVNLSLASLMLSVSFIIQLVDSTLAVADIISGVLLSGGTMWEIFITNRVDFKEGMAERGITVRKLLLFQNPD